SGGGRWAGGRSVTVRRGPVTVIGRAGNRALVAAIAVDAELAVQRVTAVWGSTWSGRVVIDVPMSVREAATLVGPAVDLLNVAAVETALSTGPPGGPSYGDRVVVNPATFARLSGLGRRVVLTHEVMHVASRQATGPDVPIWLVEGLADYVAYLGAALPVVEVASELASDVAAGQLPTRLPRDADFRAADPNVAQAYEQSWLAVRLLATRYGTGAVLDLYRRLGAYRGAPNGQALDAVLRSRLRTSRADFVRSWLRALRDLPRNRELA
ncbi:MAG: hypothetical protein M3N21_07255, partial [Actinomycetota bacterium]|nr:hypothetical protein [Actinomycetota bacterium]